MAGTRLDGRVERGNRTRQLVLRRTVDIASVEGLDALSVGRLATELELSKSGVFALFGSKQELQLATVREAARVYVERIVRPATETPAGIDRLWRLCTLWLDYSQGRVFPGGCFFYEVVAEFDARSGPVHDAVVRAQRDWTDHVEATIAEAANSATSTPAPTPPTRLRTRRVDGDGQRRLRPARRDDRLPKGPRRHRLPAARRGDGSVPGSRSSLRSTEVP